MISRGILRNTRTVLSRSARSFSLLGARGAKRTQVPLQQVPRAAFAFKVDKLVTQLENEIKFEEDEYQPVKSKNKILQKSGFQLEENDNDRLVILKKEDEQGNQIKILFEARAPVQQDNYQNQQEENEEEAPESLDDFMDFSVTVSKDGKKGIVAECSCFNSELTVNYITVSDDVDSYTKENKYVKNSLTYLGPEFSSLDERLQVALQEYLQSLGVDDNIVTFVELYSVDKEQRLYMKWLTEMKDFVQP